MAGNLPGAHAARVHRHDLVIEARKAPLVLGDQLRIEAALTIARDCKLNLGRVRDHRLAAIAVAAVANLIIVPEMMIHLSIERAFRQRLLQRIQQTALLKRSRRIAASQKLVQKLSRHNRFLAS